MGGVTQPRGPGSYSSGTRLREDLDTKTPKKMLIDDLRCSSRKSFRVLREC